ncbi:oligosaccharyl transferase, archaeosortase A system-associated [Chloroflexota bacterium]
MLDKLSPKMFTVILVGMFFAIALSIRTFLPYDQVFTGGWIKFTSIDAYHHMRIVDNLVHNFPFLTNFDPYFIYPGGHGVGTIYFYDWLLAGITWLIGLGSPTQHTIDVVGVYYPAVLGALTVIPAYFIGRELFNRWVGVLSSALIAVMGGEFLGRSILGFTDQHVAETLFTTVTIMFLILALKTARERQLTFKDLKFGALSKSIKPLIYCLLAGLSLLIYLITWYGALLFIFIITLFFIIQFIIDHWRRKSTDYLGITGAIIFLIPLLLFTPSAPSLFYIIPLIIAFIIPLALNGVSRIMVKKGIKSVYYPTALVVLGLIILGVFYLVKPTLLSSMASQFSILNPLGDRLTTTLEMQPIFFPSGIFSWGVVWGNFSTGFYLSIISLLILAWRFKRGAPERNLLLIWSIVIVLATLGQRRFAYYLAVNVAILTGYFSWQFLQLVFHVTDWLSMRISFADFRTKMTNSLDLIPTPAPEEGKKRTKRENNFYPLKYAFLFLTIIAVFFFVYMFNINGAVKSAKQARFAPSDAWHSALYWMKDNTPDPFGGSDSYYQLYERPQAEESFNYPESAYGVISWWDYGYWITRIAHRLPYTNPSQDPIPITNIARFLLSQDENSAREPIQEADSAYIILDSMMATSKFWAFVSWADKDLMEFIEPYYFPYEDNLVPVNLFTPAYYNSMNSRLYNFDGKAVIPEDVLVISYEEKVTSQEKTIRVITDFENLPGYDEALEFIESKQPANYKIVGNDPLHSTVPLEALEDYKLVFSSPTGADPAGVPEVKIFEYIGDRVK